MIDKVNTNPSLGVERTVDINSNIVNILISTQLTIENTQVEATSELSTPERSSDPSLEEQFVDVIISKGPAYESESAATKINFNTELSTPERSSDPLLEEQFSAPFPNNISVLNINDSRVEAEEEDINAYHECESLEDITVYEVVTEYQTTPQPPATKYPSIISHYKLVPVCSAERSEWTRRNWK